MSRPSEKSLALARLLFPRVGTIEGLAGVLDDLDQKKPVDDLDLRVYDAVVAGAWCAQLVHRQLRRVVEVEQIVAALERLRHGGRIFYKELPGGGRGWDITRRGAVDADTKR